VFLGKYRRLKHIAKLGELILPIAPIRDEGTSNDYTPPEVPAPPAFSLQEAISTTIRDFKCDYWISAGHTSNRRV
jgi:AMP nucleosidase